MAEMLAEYRLKQLEDTIEALKGDNEQLEAKIEQLERDIIPLKTAMKLVMGALGSVVASWAARLFGAI